jgi:hypothetical protein
MQHKPTLQKCNAQDMNKTEVVPSVNEMPPLRAGGEASFEGSRGSYDEINMRIDEGTALAKGQIWKTGIADIEIIGLGKEFMHYRVTKRAGIPGVSTQISGIDAMKAYLKRNAALLASEVLAGNRSAN